jgi:hypothetical protein
LATVSVVMIARAAAPQPSAARAPCSAGNTAVMRSTGSGSPITPVENGSTASAAHAPACASASQQACAAVRPAAPVPALALPALISR